MKERSREKTDGGRNKVKGERETQRERERNINGAKD